VELISLIALGVLSVIAAASSKLAADEFKAWLPSVIKHLIGWAIRSLPDDKRERYAEEWQSHIDETPGEIGKLIVGLGLLPAAWKLSRIIPRKPRARQSEEIVAAVRDQERWARKNFIVRAVTMRAARERRRILQERLDQQTLWEMNDLVRRIAVEEPNCEPFIKEWAAAVDKAAAEGFEEGYRSVAAARGQTVNPSDMAAAIAKMLDRHRREAMTRGGGAGT
jgi:hypothetical protein